MSAVNDERIRVPDREASRQCERLARVRLALCEEAFHLLMKRAELPESVVNDLRPAGNCCSTEYQRKTAYRAARQRR